VRCSRAFDCVEPDMRHGTHGARAYRLMSTSRSWRLARQGRVAGWLARGALALGRRCLPVTFLPAAAPLETALSNTCAGLRPEARPQRPTATAQPGTNCSAWRPRWSLVCSGSANSLPTFVSAAPGCLVAALVRGTGDARHPSFPGTADDLSVYRVAAASVVTE
jgi:hypothetical protein